MANFIWRWLMVEVIRVAFRIAYHALVFTLIQKGDRFKAENEFQAKVGIPGHQE
jgi:hypothetical protein